MIINKFLTLTLFLIPVLTKSCLGNNEPAGFLVPPPVPQAQHDKKIQRSVPLFQFPTPQAIPKEIYNGQTDPPGLMQRVARWFGFGADVQTNTLNNISPERAIDFQLQQTSVPPEVNQKEENKNQHINIKNVQQQLTQASFYQPQYKENPVKNEHLPYHYNKPKANCNPCNKIPWIPMWPDNLPLLSGHNYNSQHSSLLPPDISNNANLQNLQQALGEIPQNHIYNPQQQANLQQFIRQQQQQAQQQSQQQSKQQQLQENRDTQQKNLDFRNYNQLRAVRFNNPGSNLQLIPPPHLSIPPIPLPNLSAVPIPPLYNAQSFIENSPPAATLNNVPYIDHIEQPSEIHPIQENNQKYEGNVKNYGVREKFQNNKHLSNKLKEKNANNENYEIIKSVSVTDYISSIEYPIKLTQSSVLDFTKNNSFTQRSQTVQKNNNTNQQTIQNIVELGSFEKQTQFSTKPYVSTVSPSNLISLSSLGTPTPSNADFSSISNSYVPELFYNTEASAYIGSFGDSVNLDFQPDIQTHFINQNISSVDLQNQIHLKQQTTLNQENYKINSQPNKNSEIFLNYVTQPEQLDFVGSITSLQPPSRTNAPNFLSAAIISHEPSDNYPEESSHNLTINKNNYIENANYIEPPTKPPALDSFFETTTLQTFQYNFHSDSESKTSFDIVPSLETASEYPELFKDYLNKSKTTTQAPVLYNHNDDIYPGKPFSKYNDDSTNSFDYVSWALQPTPTSTYTSVDASGKFAGMSPPSEFQPPLMKFGDSVSDKQPKKIHQLIIPYTTKVKPRPFKLREEQKQQLHQKENFDNRYSNWLNSHEIQEVHDPQESKLVTATLVTHPTEASQKNTKYLTKILASNIRELLKREHEKRNKTDIENNIQDPQEKNLKQLQKNIDDWTEQEFTSLKHKASTASIQKPSKIIPSEYLTTTKSLRESEDQKWFDETTQKTITKTVHVTKPMKTSTMLSMKDDFIAHLEDNSVFSFVSNKKNRLETYTKSYMKNRTMTYASTSTTTSTTVKPTINTPKTITSKTTSTTTTNPILRIITSTMPFYHRNIKTTKSPNSKELWQNLKVSISPLTNEKVYVVTPVPRFQTTPSTPFDGIGTFKSPRFIVRPAPAASINSSGATDSSNKMEILSNQIGYSNTEKTLHKPYTPELFGLMGISAFVPDEPADISDGHSRVITVVTPTPHNKKRSIKYIELTRTTPSRVLPLFKGNS